MQRPSFACVQSSASTPRHARGEALVRLAMLVGCGPSVDAAQAESSTTAATVQTSTGGVESTSSSSEHLTSSGEPTTTGAQQCVKSIVADTFVQVTEAKLGNTSVADVDFDGELDVVGGMGVIIFSDLTVLALDVGEPDDGRIGEFTGDDALDLVYSGPDEALVVIPSVVDGGETPIATPGASALTFTVGDYDRDGIGDVAAGYSNGVQVWHGEGDGTFTSPGLFGPGEASDLTFFTQDGEVRLLTTQGLGDAGGVYRQDAGVFVLYDDFPQPSVVTAEEVDFMAGQTGHVLMSVWWDLPLAEVVSSYSVVHDQGDGWGGWEYDLQGGFPYDAAMIDIDADGIAEAAVIEADPDNNVSLSFVCVSGDRLVRCGTTPVPPIPQRVELLPHGPRVVIATKEDGAWIADVTVTPCVD
jgi:hypothetical protein